MFRTEPKRNWVVGAGGVGGAGDPRDRLTSLHRNAFQSGGRAEEAMKIRAQGDREAGGGLR